MEVKFEIEAGLIDETVGELFKSLSADDKKNIVKQLVTEWLKEPYSVERDIYEHNIMQNLRKKYSHAGETDEQIRRSYDYSTQMNNFKSSKEKMIEEVKVQTTEYYKQTIIEQIKNDEVIIKMRDELYKEYIKMFPTLMLETAMLLFSKKMNDMENDIVMSVCNSNLTKTMLDDIWQRLNTPKY